MAEELGGIVYTTDLDTSGLLKGEKVVNSSLDKMDKNLKNLDVQTKRTGNSLDSMGRNAGQAGIQIQQLVGQIQGGQDAMLALSAQAADLGVVLGAPLLGSVIGIAAALSGSLIPSLISTTDELEDLIARLDELEDKSGITINQSKLLIQEKQKEAAAIGESTQAIAEEIMMLQERRDLMTTAGTGVDTGQFAIPRTAIQNQERYAQAISETDARLVELRATLDDNNASLIAVNKEITELQVGTSESNEELDEFIRSLEHQRAIMGLTERGIALYTAELLGANPAQVKYINATYDLIEAKELEQEQSQNMERQLKLEELQRERLAQKVTNIGLSQLQRIEQDYQKELMLLQEAREQGIELEIGYAEREKQIAKNKTDAIARYNRDQMQSQSLLSSSQASFLDALGQSFGNFAEIARRGGEEQFKNYKKLAIAQSLISTFLAVNNALASAPPPANFILAGAVGALGLANVALINNQQYGGAREFGGPVTAGKSYLVGERGPEVVTMGASGSVTSNKDAFGGSGIQNFNVYNYAGNDLEFEPRQNGNDVDLIVRKSVDAVASQISTGNGKVANALRQSGSYRTDGRR